MRKLAIGVLAATMFVAACGGGSSKKTGAGDNTTTTAASTTTSPGGGGSDELAQLIAKRSTASVKITYNYVGGTSLTIAQDGKGKSSVVIGGNLVISDGKKTITCDGTASSATCTDISSLSGGSAAAGVTSVLSSFYSGLGQLSASDYGGHTSSETIAGRDATCVTYKASFLGQLAALAGGTNVGTAPSSVTCVDKETGFALKVSIGDGTNTTQLLLATQAGESSSSDFEPPSTPQTVPALPGGITIPTIPSG